MNTSTLLGQIIPKRERATPVDVADSDTEKPSFPFIKRFVQPSSNIWAENRILKALLCVLLLLFIVDIALGISNRHSVRTIVVPFGSRHDLQIVGNEPSEDYLRGMTRNVVSLFGTFTAGTIQQQFDELLTLVHPSKYTEIRDALRGVEKEVKTFNTLAFAMYPRSDAPIKRYRNRIEVPTSRIRYLGQATRREEGTLVIDYLVEQGRFWITGLKFILPNTPANQGSADE
jgi:conjugal transfer pilus assembly protein TraE